MNFRGKCIILISPEPWGKLFISKHNYAIALAKLGNDVYFLNPIDLTLRFGEIKMESSKKYPQVKIVTYRPYFPLFLKFHATKIFDLLIKWNIELVVKKIAIKPDIVWDFNCSYLYNDLSIFHAPLKIFNPVDYLAENVRMKSADLVLSISNRILEQYKLKGVPKFRINHGLAEPFALMAEEKVKKATGVKIRIGYVGNLANSSLDFDTLLTIVSLNPSVEFNFIGPVSTQGNNLGSNSTEVQIKNKLLNLRQHSNVIFHGEKNQSEVVWLINQYDALLLCYKNTPTFKSDNSHKIMEYLSSGNVVISTHLSAYEGCGLVEMSEEGMNFNLPSLFQKIVNNIDFYNRPELSEKRRQFALENTYERQIINIEKLINSLNDNKT